jgi:hypothetical protein
MGRVALAEVLGKAAEEIRVRDRVDVPSVWALAHVPTCREPRINGSVECSLCENTGIQSTRRKFFLISSI